MMIEKVKLVTDEGNGATGYIASISVMYRLHRSIPDHDFMMIMTHHAYNDDYDSSFL